MASGEDIESFLTTDVKNGYSLGKFLFSGFSVLRSLTPRTRITTVDLALFVAWSKKWVGFQDFGWPILIINSLRQ